MPKINPEHLSKEYRYMWGCGGFEQAFFKGAVSFIHFSTFLTNQKSLILGFCPTWRFVGLPPLSFIVRFEDMQDPLSYAWVLVNFRKPF